ncbi:MAG: histidinol dehydrogenase [Candidatus Hydrogenedentota bacterium]
MRRFEIIDDTTFAEALRLAEQIGSGAETGALEDKRAAVARIAEAVRHEGDAAVARFTKEFDHSSLTPEQFEVSAGEFAAARSAVDPNLVAILERAQENIRRFHAKNLRQSWEETSEDGMVLGQRVTPIDRVGVYVPGGKAFYPSSVLMNIVPAKVAGVKEIIMVSPPSYDGGIHPVVLTAAQIAGADRVFRVGGAQAVAALAYGTAVIPRVMKITGPGNIYVTLAKALVRGRVDIDSEAGPSEVVVIADDKANPAYVAAELLAQAEHDEDALCVLVTTSRELAEATLVRLSDDIAKQPRHAIINRALQEHGLVVIARDMDDAVALTNGIAPEHLSIQTEFPRKVSDRIRNAGAMMLGGMTPVAVGDYYAGPNHILPTGRRARFQSPLSAEDFRKVTSIIAYSRERLAQDGDDITALAEIEGLHAHARAIEVRRK